MTEPAPVTSPPQESSPLPVSEKDTYPKCEEEGFQHPQLVCRGGGSAFAFLSGGSQSSAKNSALCGESQLLWQNPHVLMSFPGSP